MDSLKALLTRQLSAAWPHRWTALAAAWVICLIGWFGVYLLPSQYEANARLYVDADAVLTPLLKGIAADSSPASQLEILQRTLLSRPNLEQLIKKTPLDLSVNSPEGRERLIQRLGKDIKISPETKTLFSISYRNSSPTMAYDVVQQLLTIFVERATGTNRTDMESARKFLENQIASYEEQLRAAEKRRAEFRTKYIDLLPSDLNGGVSRLDVARTQVAALQGQLQDAIVKRDSLKREVGSTPQRNGGEGGAGQPSRLKQAQDQLAELRLRYTEQHPDIVALKNLIASMKSGSISSSSGGAGGRTGSDVNPLYEQMKMRLIDAEGDVTSLQRQVQEATKQRDRLQELARAAPGVQAESENLDRDYNVLRKNYEELLNRRESANIAQAATTQADKVKLQIIDPAQVPTIPVAPNRLLLIPGVLVVGLAAGAGLAYLLGQMDRSFRTLDDLRALGVPVLGGISVVGAAPARRQAFSALGFSFGILLLVAVCGGLLTQVLRLGTSV